MCLDRVSSVVHASARSHVVCMIARAPAQRQRTLFNALTRRTPKTVTDVRSALIRANGLVLLKSLAADLKADAAAGAGTASAGTTDCVSMCEALVQRLGRC